jgi:hypothetical protein
MSGTWRPWFRELYRCDSVLRQRQKSHGRGQRVVENPKSAKATIGTRPRQRNPAFLRQFFVSMRQCVLLRRGAANCGSIGWGEVRIGSVGQAKEKRFSLKKSKIDFDIESHNTGTNLQTQQNVNDLWADVLTVLQMSR